MAAVSIRLNPAGLVLVAVSVTCLVLYAFDIPKWFKSEQKVEMKELLSVAIDLAERGGTRVKIIREQANADNAKGALAQEVKGQTKEGKDELKTNGDDESHKAMMNGFLKAYPGMKVHSEEHSVEPLNLASIHEPNRHRADISRVEGQQSIPIRDITVWIDPLDATQEYSENLVQYVTTMVCIAVRGQPKIGVIHFPFSGETVWGWVGYGSSLKPSAAAAEKSNQKEQPRRIIVSRSHAGSVSPVAKKAFGNETVVIPAGGAGYKTVQVINGEADAYVHVTAIKKWDICAGNAIMLSVEGRMTTLHGSDVNYADSGSVVNEKGLLATLHDHKKYLENLEPVFDALQKKDSSYKSSTHLKHKRSTEVAPKNSVRRSKTGRKIALS